MNIMCETINTEHLARSQKMYVTIMINLFRDTQQFLNHMVYVQHLRTANEINNPEMSYAGTVVKEYIQRTMWNASTT